MQGTDHYYTLQGWLRGVNTPTLDRTLDPGTDGVCKLPRSSANDYWR